MGNRGRDVVKGRHILSYLLILYSVESQKFKTECTQKPCQPLGDLNGFSAYKNIKANKIPRNLSKSINMLLGSLTRGVPYAWETSQLY